MTASGENGYDIAVSSYVEQGDNCEAVDIKQLDAEIRPHRAAADGIADPDRRHRGRPGGGRGIKKAETTTCREFRQVHGKGCAHGQD